MCSGRTSDGPTCSSCQLPTVLVPTETDLHVTPESSSRGGLAGLVSGRPEPRTMICMRPTSFVRGRLQQDPDLVEFALELLHGTRRRRPELDALLASKRETGAWPEWPPRTATSCGWRAYEMCFTETPERVVINEAVGTGQAVRLASSRLRSSTAFWMACSRETPSGRMDSAVSSAMVPCPDFPAPGSGDGGPISSPAADTATRAGGSGAPRRTRRRKGIGVH